MGDIISMQEKTFAGYQEYKATLDTELNRTAESFVRIGYLFKVARDTDILKESGYSTVTEFAQAEYNLDKTQVSRFIHINDRFSEGGYGARLDDKYRDYGYAKLTIMLQLPDELNEELTPAYSKADIQAIKDELDEDQKVSDIELMIESTEQTQRQEAQPPEGSLLIKALWELGKEQPELYKKLWKVCEQGEQEKIRDILAPQGDATYMPRIPGMGRLTVLITDARVSVVTRTREKETYAFEDVVESISAICPVAGLAEDAYEEVYGLPFPAPEEPEKPSVAPVQPPKRKESKVTKAATPPKPAPKPAPKSAEPEAPEEDIQIPGQMSVGDYEGVVPEATYEEIKEESKDGGNTGNNQDVTDLSDGVGAAGDALQPGADAGASGEPETDAACDPDEGTGVAEGGGCETDHGTVEDIWMEIYKNHSDLTKYLTVWEAQRELMEPEMIGKLYQMSVAMAAGFERLMRRAGNE